MKLLDKVLALLFARTQIDETVETILGSLLSQIDRLQALANAKQANAESDIEYANELLQDAQAAKAEAGRAEGIAKKLKALVG